MDRGPVSSLATRVALSTPPERDRVIDAVRAASLLVVVAGHWLMADITLVGGEVRAGNVLSVLPWLHAVTWIMQVIPLFFIAGGFANLTVWRRVQHTGGGYRSYLHGRIIRLLRPVLVFALVAQSLLGLAWLAGLAARDAAFVAQLLGRPLWFLAVYVLVMALAPAMAVWHSRAPALALLTPILGAVVVDVVRLTHHVDGLGHANFLLVWLVAQQLGFWYADRHRLALTYSVLCGLVAGVLTVMIALTVYGPYPVSMIGLAGEMSNMNPPSVCLMLLGVGQAAVVGLARPVLAGWLERPAIWAGVVTLGARAMTIYVWHLMALVIVVGAALSLDAALPAGGTMWWWLSRPAWLVCLAVVLLMILLPLSRLERGRHHDAGRVVTRARFRRPAHVGRVGRLRHIRPRAVRIDGSTTAWPARRCTAQLAVLGRRLASADRSGKADVQGQGLIGLDGVGAIVRSEIRAPSG